MKEVPPLLHSSLTLILIETDESEALTAATD